MMPPPGPITSIASAVETVVSPTMAPTEMSSPPETITTVWLIARTPRIVTARPMLRMLRGEKNTSPRRPPKIATRMTSARMSEMLWMPIRSTRRRPVGTGRAAVSLALMPRSPSLVRAP